MPTRLYVSHDNQPAVSPAFAAAWDDASFAIQRKLLSSKSVTESLLFLSYQTTGQTGLCCQAVSDPLTAQTISGSVMAYARCRDVSAGGSATTRLYIAVVSGDGATIRGVLLALGGYGTGLAFSGVQNRAYADGHALNSVAVQDGDRLVVEFGANDPNAGTLLLRIGAPSGTADQPEDETSAADLVSWVEFSGVITFQVGGVNGAPNMLLVGVG